MTPLGGIIMADAPNDTPDDSDEEYFPEFRTVRRGYDPEQVEDVLDELYTSLSDAVRDAEEHASRLQSAERARDELDSALTEAKHRIAELEKRPAAGGASFESLGSRIGDILAAASAEASEITRRAHEEAQALHDESEATAVTTRAETDHYASDVRNRAQKEAKGIKERARAEAERILADAHVLRETQQRADVEAYERLAAELAERQAHAEGEFARATAAQEQRLASLAAQIDGRAQELQSYKDRAEAEAQERLAQARTEAQVIVEEARRIREEAMQDRARVRAQLADVRQRLARAMAAAAPPPAPRPEGNGVAPTPPVQAADNRPANGRAQPFVDIAARR
jgi:cell division septum initiation protein DivIVA